MRERTHNGVALTALAAIGVVTASWWALALYPASTAAPEWLLRTRLACFGAAANGLPDAGGWILLVGEPIGMLGVLVAVWGDALRRDVRELAARRWGRAVLAGSALLVVWGGMSAASVVSRATTTFDGRDAGGVVSTQEVPPLHLTDQRGQIFDLQSSAAQPVLITFGFAHCETVCPVVVRDVLRARSAASRNDVPLVIVTVDPWRDVPARLTSIATQWGLAPGDRVLSGSVDEVNRTLDDWGVAHSRDEATGDVTHGVAVVLVEPGARSGRRMTGSLEPLTRLLAGS